MTDLWSMTNPWIAALSALFLWWFSTGIILWRVRRADNQGHDAHLWSVLLGLPLLLGGVVGLNETLTDTSATGAYLAFLSALALWAWVELAFLSGIIAGPNTNPCPPGAALPDRFLRAIGTILWHEILLITLLCALVILSHDAPNIFGLWTFAILFFARISAKLNLFFGVPRIHTEFLPRPLAHLASHFRRAPMNAVFPVSITALSYASYCFTERALTAPTPGSLIGFTLLSALTLLALLEHWFMVIPLPDQKLWRWMLPERKPQPQVMQTLRPTLKEKTHGL
ncbi:putative photosynthetic complex assembly protein PuhE [Pseudotabrizicola sp. 4114]|uniref:putative photosynthetic complex assembly protein PuhE n=1 Tax=Pseudotabrizicola sp. 4114 TaxID=2817731 RepID=UPI00285DD127|nr:putative photosynthetic complex assembly protein 2 [Pseudorhodobacter sp. 4114]